MKAIYFLLGIFIAFVFQAKISLFGVSPDLTAVMAYYFGIKGGATKGILLGSFIGIIEDSVAGAMLGPNLLGKGMVGFFGSFMSGSLFRWTPLLGMISLFLLTIIDGVSVFLSKAIFETTPAPLSTAIFTLMAQGLLNLIMSIFIKPENVD